MTNPFETIDARLSNIENMLLDLSRGSDTVKITPDQGDLLTVPDAALFLNLAIPTIYGMISKKTLPFMKKSRKVYFSKKELMEYIKSGRNKSRDEIEADADQYLANKKRLSR